MYLAMNRFQVAPGQDDAFEAAWRSRESYLDGVPGFVSFWLLRGPGGDFISCSRWESEAAFRAWTESEAFRKAHSQARLPSGVILGPPRFTGYDVVLSQGEP